MPIPHNELGTAAQIAKLVRSKQIAPLEALESCLVRVAERNPSLNALVHIDEAGARARAQQLQDRIMRGEDPGILCGVPTAMKDLFNTYPGWPSTFGGIPALRDFKPPARSAYPRRMEASGAIVIGSTNSPIFGFRGTCDNPLFGATNNPFDLTRNSGGSSGGSAAAVAGGLLTIGGANDGGGSIRIPSAWCGAFGFQPSFGRIPQAARPDAFDISPFVYDGAITRTVEDGALALAALACFDNADPFSNPENVDWQGSLNFPIRGMKIGFSSDLGGYPINPAISEQTAQAVRAFEILGVEIVDLSFNLPFAHDELTRTWCCLVGTRMAGALDIFKSHGVDIEKDHRDDLPDETWTYIDQARTMSLNELRHLQIIRTTVYDLLQQALQKVDFIACPTVASLPVKNSTIAGKTLGPSTIDGRPVDPLIGWCLTYWTNMSGNPAASLPTGLVDGLPVGLQLIGKRNSDVTLLAACRAFEEARPWSEHYELCEEKLEAELSSRY